MTNAQFMNALTDTLYRLNRNYGRGNITQIIFDNWSDIAKTKPSAGFCRVELQSGSEAPRFDLFTAGNGKIRVKFRGRERICKETKAA